MSSKDFLDRMRKKADDSGYSGGGGAGIVGRMMIEVGLHRYVAGHDFWSFWKPIPDIEEMDVIGQELSARLQEAGSTDVPVFGLKITIKANVMGRDEPYKADLQEFIPEWQADSFELIADSIEKNNLPIGEIFYGRAQYKANPFFVKKGEEGKTETDQNGKARYPSIRLPVEKFANEAAAKAAAGGSGSSANTNSQWSEKARATYPDLSVLEGFANEINEWLKKATQGIAYVNNAESYPLPEVPITPPKAKKYIADIYDCEPADIDMLIPF
jgi:hypothetical protein